MRAFLDRARDRPGDDDRVADVAVDLAVVRGDVLAHVGDHAIEQREEALVADALGDRGRADQVEQQEGAFLDHRTVVATGDQRHSTPWPSSAVDLHQRDDQQRHRERVGDVADEEERAALERRRELPDRRQHGEDPRQPQRGLGEDERGEGEAAQRATDRAGPPDRLHRRDAEGDRGAGGQPAQRRARAPRRQRQQIAQAEPLAPPRVPGNHHAQLAASDREFIVMARCCQEACGPVARARVTSRLHGDAAHRLAAALGDGDRVRSRRRSLPDRPQPRLRSSGDLRRCPPAMTALKVNGAAGFRQPSP